MTEKKAPSKPILRRHFATMLGAGTAMLTGVPLLAHGGAKTTKTPAPNPTPIDQTPLAPTTIGSYQRKNGYFTWAVTANGANRGIEVYIPQGARQREFWIGITLPQGVRSNEFLNDAGWFDTADMNRVCLLVMKPDSSGVWGDPATELEYVRAAMATLVSNGPHYSALTYHYVVGYGAGAAPLQLYAASSALSMICQVYVEPTAATGYPALLTAAGDTQVGPTPQPNDMDFVGYTDINGAPVTAKRTFAAQFYRDIPIPTWFVGSTPNPLLSYWADVNDCPLTHPTVDPDFGRVYWQDKARSNAIATSDSDVKSQVAVRPLIVGMDSPLLTEDIYAFLSQYSGYDNNSVYGHFITKRLDYAKAIAAGSMICKDHLWSGSTTLKSYIVYVPDSVKKNYSLNKPAPVLFCTHGAGQTAFVFFEATDIKELANRYGFIAVTYDDTSVAYMRDLVGLVKEDCRNLGVAADDRRLYVYGQSAGGGAVTNFARDEALARTFAAFGHTSGTYSNPSATASNALVPFYTTYGEYDYWPMKFGPVGAGDWRGSTGQSAATNNMQNYWLGRLIGTTVTAELAAPTYGLADGISASLATENTPISLILKPTATANRYKTFTWARNGVPLFTFGQCYGRGHNLIPGDIRKMWEEFYSKWQRSDQPNTLQYWSQGVGVGQAALMIQE
jgi:poly(3-hydroxybutyrate) depolymerase